MLENNLDPDVAERLGEAQVDARGTGDPVAGHAEMLQGLSWHCEICADQPLARKIG